MANVARKINLIFSKQRWVLNDYVIFRILARSFQGLVATSLCQKEENFKDVCGCSFLYQVSFAKRIDAVNKKQQPPRKKNKGTKILSWSCFWTWKYIPVTIVKQNRITRINNNHSYFFSLGSSSKYSFIGTQIKIFFDFFRETSRAEMDNEIIFKLPTSVTSIDFIWIYSKQRVLCILITIQWKRSLSDQFFFNTISFFFLVIRSEKIRWEK